MLNIIQKNIRRFLIVSFIFISLNSLSFAIEQNMYAFTSQEDALRFENLTKEIRCVVCQNQNIADSHAPLANDLREKIYLMVKDQQSDEKIKDYLVKRYGEYILLEPRFNSLTWLLWLFPFIGICLIFLFMFHFIRASKTT